MKREKTKLKFTELKRPQDVQQTELVARDSRTNVRMKLYFLYWYKKEFQKLLSFREKRKTDDKSPVSVGIIMLKYVEYECVISYQTFWRKTGNDNLFFLFSVFKDFGKFLPIDGAYNLFSQQIAKAAFLFAYVCADYFGSH